MEHSTALAAFTNAAHRGVLPAAQFPLAIMQINLEATSPVPLYQQLCRAIAAAISAGDLPRGGQLPTAKELAAILGVGRHTVLAAYSRLSAEGYTSSSRRRGTRISDSAPSLNAGRNRPSDGPSASARAWEISFRAQRQWFGDDVCTIQEEAQRALHAPDPSLYPRVILGRLIAEDFGRPLTDPENATAAYQGAVASLLRQMRGVDCEPEHVIPLQSFENALDLVSRLLIDPGHCVYVENPAATAVWRGFQSAGAYVTPVPSDRLGTDVTRADGPPPRLIFASPSLSFPFGRQMTEQRRAALLARARQSRALIFECDRYWELALSGGQIGAIQGLEDDAPVVYFGSFSETLGPHLRAAYLVVPKSLADVFATAAQSLSYGIDPFVLSAIARFIEGNFHTAHTKSLRSAYAQRLDKVATACRACLPQAAVSEPAGGFSLALNIPHLDEDALVSGWKNANLPVAALSKFFYPGSEEVLQGLVLGFGTLSDRLIDATIKRFSDVVRDCT